MEATDCQLLYVSLLKRVTFTPTKDETPRFIRDLEATKECDLVATDLSLVRNRMRDRLGPTVAMNFNQHKESTLDIMHAQSALVHYKTWHQDVLYQSLSWEVRVYYLTGAM